MLPYPISSTARTACGKELRDHLDALDALEQCTKGTHACRWRMIRKFIGKKKGKRCKKCCDNCKKFRFFPSHNRNSPN